MTKDTRRRAVSVFRVFIALAVGFVVVAGVCYFLFIDSMDEPLFIRYELISLAIALACLVIAVVSRHNSRKQEKLSAQMEQKLRAIDKEVKAEHQEVSIADRDILNRLKRIEKKLDEILGKK